VLIFRRYVRDRATERIEQREFDDLHIRRAGANA
jgi:hypothetical protein